MSKRSLSSWLALPLLVAAGCGGGGKSTTDMGAHAGADLAVAGNTADMSGGGPGADMSAAAGDMASGGGDMAAPLQGPAPFVVDTIFAASGYYNEAGGKIVDDASCPTRAGGKRGTCHHITYTPAASTGGYAGILWQYPANNWPGPAQLPGYVIPTGYTRVQFWAWGAVGGEVLNFSALDSYKGGDGYDNGTKRSAASPITLTTTPTLYTVGVAGNYGAAGVATAFAWDLGSATHANQFYIDDLVYSTPDVVATAPVFNIDTNFAASGYMGDGANPGELVDTGDCTPTVPGAHGCHHFTWNPTIDGGAPSNGWAGVYWQSSLNDWGAPTDAPGKAIPAGYTEVSFYAWSAKGGESVSFFAGLGVDNFAPKINVVLTQTPTLYTLGIGGLYGARVVGGFGWSVGGSGISLDIDGVQWR